MSGPREEDGDYAREFFDTYERAADDLTGRYPDATGSLVGASRQIARLTRERDEARAQVARVRALASKWEHGALRWADPLEVPVEVGGMCGRPVAVEHDACRGCKRDLRDAYLAGERPYDVEREGL